MGKTIIEILKENERKQGMEGWLTAFEKRVKEYGIKEDKEAYFYKQGVADTEIVNEKQRQVKSYIVTKDCDRMGDIMIPGGAILENYRRNPVVLWVHRQDLLPIGKNLWIKTDNRGLIALTQYRNTQFAEDVWKCRKEGLLGYSIGYLALEEIRDKREIERYMKENDLTGEPLRIVTKWELFEYSDVLIPANPYALEPERMETETMKHFIIEVKSGKITCPTWDNVNKCQKNEELTKLVGGGGDIKKEEQTKEGRMEVKRVIPFEDLGYVEDEKEVWDAASEVTSADVEDLKKMCAWYDEEKPDVKASYKLPHHRQKDKKAVWRGVVAAMAALFGARGGVNIPDEDRKGVYEHLAKHYEHWDKTPPEFREYTQEEVAEMEKEEREQLQEEQQEKVKEERPELTEEDAKIYKMYALLFAEGEKLPKMKGYSAYEIVRKFPDVFIEKHDEKQETHGKKEQDKQEEKRYITKEQAEKIAKALTERMLKHLTEKQNKR